MQTLTLLARYFPRAIRSAVASTFNSGGSPTLGSAALMYVSAPAITTTSMTSTMLMILKNFFIAGGGFGVDEDKNSRRILQCINDVENVLGCVCVQVLMLKVCHSVR